VFAYEKLLALGRLLTRETTISPPSKGTTFEKRVEHKTESSLVIDVSNSSPKKALQSLKVSAKYCHGFQVCPLSVDLSSAKTPGLGELAILMKT
jgi:hypothetical protein